jgi:hypothetical protein
VPVCTTYARLATQAVTAVLAAQSGSSSAAHVTGDSAVPGLPPLPKLAVSVADYEPFTYMRDIKANLIGSSLFFARRGWRRGTSTHIPGGEQASLWRCGARWCG